MGSSLCSKSRRAWGFGSSTYITKAIGTAVFHKKLRLKGAFFFLKINGTRNHIYFFWIPMCLSVLWLWKLSAKMDLKLPDLCLYCKLNECKMRIQDEPSTKSSMS